MSERPLRPEEQLLIQYALDQHPHFRWNDDFSTIRVSESGDAGLGGVTATSPGTEPMLLDRVQFRDVDGVLVIVDVFTTREGWLSELSVWKVDYTPVQQFPRSPEQLSLFRR